MVRCKRLSWAYFIPSALNALKITNSDHVAVVKMRKINGLLVEQLIETELMKATKSAVEYHRNGGLSMRNSVYIDW